MIDPPVRTTGYDNVKGGLLLLLSSGLFTANDGFVKLLTHDLPVPQVLFMRGLLVCLWLYLVMRVVGERFSVAHLTQRWVLGRAASDTAATWLFIAAASQLPLADAMTIFFASPIILTALVALLLREPVGPYRWGAVLVGFVGVLIAAQPTGEWRPAVLLALGGAVFGALRDISARLVPYGTGPANIAFTTSAAITLATAPQALLGWTMPTLLQTGWLVAATVLLTAAYLVFVNGMRIGEIAVVSPIRFTAVPYAMLWGWILFGATPTAQTLLGAVVIVGSGLFIFFRERQLAKRAAAAER